MLLKFLLMSILRPICFAYILTKRYDNYTLFSAVPVTREQLDFFQSLQDENTLGVDYWSPPGSINHSVSLTVPPESKTMFLDKAEMVGIKVITVVKNVQWAFDKQKVVPYVRRSMDTFDWQNFYGIEGIYSWLEDLAVRYSDTVKLINIGKSFEGRDILGIHIPSKIKRDIFIEGGIHAREWISPAFVTYLIYQLVTAEEGDNKNLLKAMKSYSWHLFPVVNPDGYAYTHYQDRSWRKNRRKFANGNFGVDLNRNFDYNFNTVGVSQDNAKETYCGTHAFSELETEAISHYVDTIGQDLIFYISFHSFGQYFIIPYADSTSHSGNFQQVKDLGYMGLVKLKSFYDTDYYIGTAYDTVGYLVSGSSVDWAKKKYDVPVAVNFELRDRGVRGFALSPREILPTCEETLACVLEMVNLGPPRPEPAAYLKTRAADLKIKSFSEKRSCVSIYVVILNIFLYVWI